MKTSFERQFEKLITRHLAFMETTPEDRAHYIYDFHINSESYYDNICDMLYAMAVGAIEGPLWLTPSGDVYYSQDPRRTSDTFLMSSDELPVFTADITEHLEIAFLRLYRLH